MGRKLKGPVLVGKTPVIKPEAIASQHWGYHCSLFIWNLKN
jgi:hypothetical protein